ncbi:hypothetical protein NXH67_08095 [Butyrivibrio sp. DSM 10294]|uniref:hypothetical protein n=1 Tax=Butyrivibrio sp. DSM 10294 TaxID=2972457 RepID=UPI00234F3ED7|nr:hypothetical protein [Butyrivibrio sp. DSM 10294]MDC7293473.1 hypothetical protein [Butyrivibrio sp. DSM 10294]
MDKKKTLIHYTFFLLAAALCLMLASRSSFLYPLNNWDDANSYFSVGKGIFNGKMPYRDIFDQKGMYLYFFYGLCYLVSHTTFIGVFIMEIILGALDIAGMYRIVRLYAGKGVALALAPVSFAMIVCSRSFWWGGAAEEICLPFYIWGLYIVTDYFKNHYEQETMPFRNVLIGGVLAGMVANIKYTGLGFFFAWMMMVFFSYVAKKEIVRGIKACFVFLFGMFIPFVPWFIYFGVQGALYEWYWGYVYINVFLYSKFDDYGPTFFEKIYNMAKLLYWQIRSNWQYYVPGIAGLIFTFFGKGKKVLARLIVPVLFAFTFLGIFGGGREIPYYGLPLSMFAVFGVAVIAVFLDKLINTNSGSATVVLAVLCTVLSVLFVYANSMNIPFMKTSRDDFFLYRFRDEVLQTKDPTLLNVGCLDAGLYTLCDIVPTCRWFQTQTLDIDEPENNPYMEQERYVREGLIDYVLVRDDIPKSIDDHYELIDSESYGWYGYDFNYYLFKKVR